jgi:hypothetical protein
VFQIRGGQLRQITNDHTIGMLAWSADLLALVRARYLDGRPDRRADMGLRAGPATCCSPADSARLWTTDRTGMYLFPAVSTEESAS